MTPQIGLLWGDFPWRDLLQPGDGHWFSSAADQMIWRRLVRRSALREWVIPIGVDDALYRPRAAGERRAGRSTCCATPSGGRRWAPARPPGSVPPPAATGGRRTS